MPTSIRSFRAYDPWQRGRYAPTSGRNYTKATPSIAATEAPNLPSGGWASLMATARATYLREQQMTTEERVEIELRKRTQGGNNQKRDILSGTTVVCGNATPAPLTVDALAALGQHGGLKQVMEHDEEDGSGADEMVPNFSYAVAELAKSLEESRKALRKAMKEKEELKIENDQLKKERTDNLGLKTQLQKFEDWVSPDAHANLRTGWEEWADVAEKKIESQQAKITKVNALNDTLLEEIEQKQKIIGKLDLRVEAYRDWTTPHERRVLDATINMLSNNLSEMKAEMEACPTCAQKHSRTAFESTLNVMKPMLARQQTVA